MKKNRFNAAALVAALWLGLAALAWFGPRKELSLSERRKLEQFPALTLKDVESGRFMSAFETFTQDQFPLRDGFRRLKAQFTYRVLRQKDNHGIYLVDDQAAKLEYPLKEASVTGAVKKFDKIYNLYLKDRCDNIVLSVVPDKGYYLADRVGAPAMDYQRLFEIMEQIPWAKYADITDCLTAGDYYGTDTHWRQEQLVPAAAVLADALGAMAPEIGDYRMEEGTDAFCGVYYGQAALPMDPERLNLMRSDLLDQCTVYNYETGQYGSIYNMEKLSDRDPYDVFLSGPVSLLRIENPAGEPGKHLVVFRDSFGSSMVPLLVQGYETVTLVDTRYLPADYLGSYLEFDGQDILFLYSTTILNSSAVLR